MVNHLSFQDDTTEANKPATKHRYKKYTKTRRKKVENLPSPKKTWWKKNALYQLLCCQNTCYSVALYLALVLFIALFVYAVWKICDLRFASKSHQGSKRPLDAKNNASKPGVTTGTGKYSHFDPNTINSIKSMQQKPVTTTKRPITRYEPRKVPTTTSSDDAIYGSNRPNAFNGKTSESASMHDAKTTDWNQDTPYQRYLPGEKRYLIPPSPSQVNYFRSFDGSGGSTVEEWRAMRLALLRNRLKLTTGSSYPTDSPYWKSLFTSNPNVPFSNQYVTNDISENNNIRNDVSPVHDDTYQSITPLTSYHKTPTVGVSQNEKHSEINSINPNSTFAKGYTKLLADLFDKMVALRTKAARPVPAFLSGPSNSSNVTSNSTSISSGKASSNALQTVNASSDFTGNNNSTTFNLRTTSKPITTTVTAGQVNMTEPTVKEKTSSFPHQISKNGDHSAKNRHISTLHQHPKPQNHRKGKKKGKAPYSKKHKHHSVSERDSKKPHNQKNSKNWKKSKHQKHFGSRSSRPKSWNHHVSHRREKISEQNLGLYGNDGANEISGAGNKHHHASGSGSGITADTSSGSGLSDLSGSGSDHRGFYSGDDDDGEHARKSGHKKHHEHGKSSAKKGTRKSYIGLREKLMKLKKHSQTTRAHSHKKREKHQKKHDSKHHDGSRNKHSKHGGEHSRKGSKHKDKRGKKHHASNAKHKKHSKKHSNKDKYMKIVQQKLLRVKKKHEIAHHLSKVQKKLAELERRNKSRKHHKKHAKKSGKSSKWPKSLEMPAKKQHIPKHWKKGVVTVKDCLVFRIFDKTHYVGISLTKKEDKKNVYAVTDCMLKKGSHHRYKCRRFFYKTEGYMMLRRSSKLGRSNVYLLFCRHESSFEDISDRNIGDVKNAVIKSKKNKGNDDDDDDNDDDDDDDDDDDHETKTKRNEIFKHNSRHHVKAKRRKEKGLKKKHSSSANKRKKHKRHKKHKKKPEMKHSKSHSKHHHRHNRGSSHSKRQRHHSRGKNEDVDGMDSEEESGSGEDDDSASGDAEERFERSTATQHKDGDKTKKDKKHKLANDKHKHKHKHKQGRKQTDKQVSSDKTMYANLFDMMKEMKQEIRNATAVKSTSQNNATSTKSRNITESTQGVKNASKGSSQDAPTHQPASRAHTTPHVLTKTTKQTNQTKPSSLQDMVAQIVPAIMKQFASKDIMKTNSIHNDQTSTTTVTTPAKTTMKPTTRPKTTATTKRPSAHHKTTHPVKPTTSAVGKAHTQHHTPTRHVTQHHTTVRHVTVRHTTPRHHTTHHVTPKHLSKLPAKTTPAPNIALLLKGLKALGISQIGQHIPTKSPSILRKSFIPSAPRTKTPIKPQPSARNTPTKKQPLPPPMPKPLAPHNPYQMHLLCFGDSLTAGYHNHGKAFSPYGNHLRQLINLSSKIPAAVEIKGIVGEMTHKQMAARLPEVLGNSSVFDWVIILGGTNDILHVKNFADDQEFLGQLENIWQPRITKDIEKLHETAHKYGAHSMLLTVPENAIEMWPEYKILLTMRRKINTALRQYAAQHRDKVALCDIAQKLPRHSLTPQQESAFWDDHLHMTERGYSRMAEEVFKCLKAYIPDRVPGNLG